MKQPSAKIELELRRADDALRLAPLHPAKFRWKPWKAHLYALGGLLAGTLLAFADILCQPETLRSMYDKALVVTGDAVFFLGFAFALVCCMLEGRLWAPAWFRKCEILFGVTLVVAFVTAGETYHTDPVMLDVMCYVASGAIVGLVISASADVVSRVDVIEEWLTDLQAGWKRS